MADLYISEHYSAVSIIGTTDPAVLPQPALAIQKIAVGASTPSAAFGPNTKAVMLVADGPCHYVFGDNLGSAPPAASTSSMLLPANVPVIFGVSPGQKLAVST